MVECGKCGILPSDEILTILKYGFFEENLKFNYLKTFLWYEFKSNECSNDRYGMDIFSVSILFQSVKSWTQVTFVTEHTLKQHFSVIVMQRAICFLPHSSHAGSACPGRFSFSPSTPSSPSSPPVSQGRRCIQFSEKRCPSSRKQGWLQVCLTKDLDKGTKVFLCNCNHCIAILGEF